MRWTIRRDKRKRLASHRSRTVLELELSEDTSLSARMDSVYLMQGLGPLIGWENEHYRWEFPSAGQFPCSLKIDSSRFSLWSFHSEAPVDAVSLSPLSRVSQAT